MTLNDILNLPLERLEAMSDEELAKLLEPYVLKPKQTKVTQHQQILLDLETKVRSMLNEARRNS